MVKRIVTGVIAFLVLIPFLVFSDTWALPIGLSACAVLAVIELTRCVGVHRKLWITIPMCLLGAATPICVRWLGWVNMAQMAVAAVLLLVLYMLTVTVFSYGRTSVTDVCTAFVLCLYAIMGFSSVVYLHDLGDAGKYLYLLVFIGAWVTDTFAYFTGMLLGKRKLIPEVSPKKTVAGSVGGTLFCIASFVAYSFILFNADAHWTQHLYFALIGLATAVVAQVGDLAISVLKRHYGIKDMGKIFPGHGGVMDRFDSVVAVATVLAVSFSLMAL